ncbi:MAG: 2-oxo acid dehydrogenase subunit E2 [Chlorobi bacterium]|nr:2-oxo acid dehydrogenase subunit E2 [Chlorobiota bacterium]
MANIEILLPAMGEGIIEATITKWLKQKGEKVEEDESIVEIATDKVDSEIPAPQDGILDKILFQEGEIPKVGDVIAILKVEGEDTIENADVKIDISQIETSVNNTNSEANEIPGTDLIPKESEEIEEVEKLPVEGIFLSPLVKSIIDKENIDASEVKQIKGTGINGRITKNDLFSYLKIRGTKPESKTFAKTLKEPKVIISKPAININATDEIIEMDRMRRLIADYMVNSKQTSPHVTSFHEVDVTNIVNWRNKIKDEFFKREHEKLTYTPIFFEATAQVLKELPMVNVSVNGYKIIVKKNINIGMATALPNGNLIVPVIKNADQKSLIGLSKAVNNMAMRARENKLLPDEIQGGTFTITNLGTFGNLTGTPIINQPEVAILALGAIIKKPAVIETPQGDSIGIRHKMILSLAYDHRVVDGALGGMFLKKLADKLENFDVSRSI